MEELDKDKLYKEFREFGKELKVPVIEVHYSLEVTKDGRRLQKVPKTLSQSFNRNAFNWMFSQLASHPADDSSFGAGYISVKDIDNNVRYGAICLLAGRAAASASYNIESDGYGYNGVVTDDDLGIVVGVGSGAESFDGHALTTRVLHGNNPDQLHYADTDVPLTVTWTGGSKTFTSEIVRFFNNNSGGTIVVSEIGIYTRLYSSYKSMVTRDLLGATISVVDAAQLKVTYEVDLIYP